MHKWLIVTGFTVLCLLQSGCMTAARQFEHDSAGEFIFSPRNDIMDAPWTFPMYLGAVVLMPLYPITAPISEQIVEICGEQPEYRQTWLESRGKEFYLNFLFGDLVGGICSTPFWPLYLLAEGCNWLGIINWDTRKFHQVRPPDPDTSSNKATPEHLDQRQQKKGGSDEKSPAPPLNPESKAR